MPTSPNTAVSCTQSPTASYIGPWLPEPMLTTPDAADDVVRADSVSTAMLLVLEALSPTERAVFVLNEAFGCHVVSNRDLTHPT